MMRYNCKVRLGGSLHNEVRKEKVSAAEIVILRTLHGDDAVVGTVAIGNDKTPHRQERDMLEARYGTFLARLTPPTNMTTLFGPAHVKLPGTLKDVDGADPEAPDVEDESEDEAA